MAQVVRLTTRLLVGGDHEGPCELLSHFLDVQSPVLVSVRGPFEGRVRQSPPDLQQLSHSGAFRRWSA